MHMDHMSGARVFVTGADGFIGSHVVEQCVRAGASVRALSCYSSFDADGWLDDLAPEVRGSVEVLRGDVRDGALMRRACEGRDIVLHLAALIGIPYSYESPSSYVDVNVHGTLNVLMGARDAGVARVVHTSTSEVYGTAQTCPIREDHPLVGQSPYAASKIAADKLAEACFLSFGVPVVTLRPFNTFGPRQSQRAVIPTVVRQALDPAARVIEVGDVSTERDWLFVRDTAAAFIACAGPGAVLGQTYNAGTGAKISVAEMIRCVLRASGVDKPVESRQDRMRPAKSEVRVLQADHAALTAATGWAPSYEFVRGIEETVAWWRTRDIAALSKGYRV